MQTHTTNPNPCRWCGESLPPRTGRGRPKVTHDGACKRQDHNRRKFEERKAKWWRNVAPSSPRGSDLLDVRSLGLDGDEADDRPLSVRLGAAGFSIVDTSEPSGPHVAVLIEQWEEQERQRRADEAALRQMRQDAYAASRRGEPVVHIEVRHDGTLHRLTDAEIADRVASGVRRWQQRTGTSAPAPEPMTEAEAMEQARQEIDALLRDRPASE